MGLVQKYKKILLALIIAALLVGVFFSFKHYQKSLTKTGPGQTNQSGSGAIYPQTNVGKPSLDILSDSQGNARNGLIALASTDEPAVYLDGYNVSGDAEITLYQTDQNALLNFLLYDKDGKQLYGNPDTGGFQLVTTLTQKLNSGNDKDTKVSLPLGESGVWYLKAKAGEAAADAFIVRSDNGVLAKETKNELIFWSQSFKTKRTIKDGSIKILNLKNSIQEVGTSSFNDKGIATTSLNASADLALVEQGGSFAIVPLNLNGLDGGYSRSSYKERDQSARYFVFTDRPLYKPGDTVYFKAVLRDDDDARYSISDGQAQVKIYRDWDENNTVMDRTLDISNDGTISGEYVLGNSAATGEYAISIKMPSKSTINTSTYFSVEFYEKPEYSLEVTTPQIEYIAKDEGKFTLQGKYFSGQPTSGHEVQYTIYSSDFYEYQYLSDQQNRAKTSNQDFQYSYYWQNNKVKEGTIKLDQNGWAEVTYDTSIAKNEGKNKILSIEATITEGSARPAYSRKNVLVYAGKFGVYRSDESYGGQVNTNVTLPVTLLPNMGEAEIAGVDLTAKVHRISWTPYQEPDKKYPSYKKEEEDLASIKAKTDGQGNANFSLTPKKTGSYTLTIEGRDEQNNFISKVFYLYISAEGVPAYAENKTENISVTSDKQKYEPGETARLAVNSEIPDRDIFLSVERGYVERYEIVSLSGKTGSVEIQLQNDDIPNVYVVVSSFSDNRFNVSQQNVPVSTNGQKIIVKVEPESKTYGPGETANINIATTNLSGEPIAADLAFWAIDKALLALKDSNLNDIFETFWAERYITSDTANSLKGIASGGAEMGGCFVAGTKILMASGKPKNIEKVKSGEFILTRTEDSAKLIKAKVTGIHQADEPSYLLINSDLRLTANHILRVNNLWQEAGKIQIGDRLTNSLGNEVTVNSVERLTNQTKVYNLEIEKYHTFFANDFWVHNEKGGGGGSVRQNFVDTAYWNANIKTDSSGKAQVSFKLPDNLTTWAMLAVASTPETQLGQTANEITVTKNVIVRPILPNILRVGDEAVIASLIQNFTAEDLAFDVSLKFNAGTALKGAIANLPIKSGKMEQISWNVKAETEKDQAELNFSAIAQSKKEFADAIISKIPIRSFGFQEKDASFNEGNKTTTIKLQVDSQKDKSKVTLSLAPTLLGTLPSAMKYLLNYPYGCVEQTVSRLAPAIMAKNNQNLFGEALKDKNPDEIIQQSLAKLQSQQLSDGGWPWWFSGKSDPYISAHVIESLLAAKDLGFKVDGTMMSQARYYFTSKKDTDSYEDKAAKDYGMALLGEKDKLEKIANFDILSPDILALTVMANYQSGETDSGKNGLAKLESLAQKQGDSVYFEAGNKNNFGSRDASTALAIRAILLAQGNQDLAIRAAKYLTQTRHADYWSNTFATAQVAKALVELAKINHASTPNYTYTVNLDGKVLDQAKVGDANQVIKEIELPVNQIKANGSALSVTKEGEGQLYSTIVTNEWRTDRTARAENKGLSIKRKYISENGKGLALGDTVLVQLTVDGLKAESNYGVIRDELPAGLTPINVTFKNEQYGEKDDSYYTSFGVTDQETTENGVILSLYRMAPGKHTYTYKARVTSLGTFIAPPATVSLMYTPEVHGRSNVQTVKIDKNITIISGQDFESKIMLIASILAVIIALSLIVWQRRRLKEIFSRAFQKKEQPLDQP